MNIEIEYLFDIQQDERISYYLALCWFGPLIRILKEREQ